MRRRVVITGLGVVTAVGNTLGEFEASLRAGASGIRYLPKLEELNFRCTLGGVPEGIDEIAESMFPPNHLKDMDDVNRYGCIAAMRAWVDAGMRVPTRDSEPDWDSGIVFGSGSQCGIKVATDKLGPLVNAGKARKLGAGFGHKTLTEGIAARSAYFLGLGNKAVCLNSTSATGTAAILDGVRHIESGLAERMVCGGAEGAEPYGWAGLDAMRVTVKGYQGAPEAAARPMDKEASGFVPAGGAGAVVVESLESAMERGAPIYAEIIGHHTNCGAGRGDGSMTAPNGAGIRRCVRAAIEHAGRGTLSEIDLVNGHLTGTMADALELRNWIEVFESGGVKLPLIHSTKAMLGHSLVAAGAIEVAACCLMLLGDFVHAAVNCDDPLPELEPYPDSIPRGEVRRQVDLIMKANFGFGDVNTAMLLRRWVW